MNQVASFPACQTNNAGINEKKQFYDDAMINWNKWTYQIYVSLHITIFAWIMENLCMHTK